MRALLPLLFAASGVALVAAADGLLSDRLPFSILYFVPVAGVSWTLGATTGAAVAAAATVARVGTDVAWHGLDALAVWHALTWGAGLVSAAKVVAWGRARRDEVTTLESRVGELIQIEHSFARTDPLTSLCNERAFVDALRKAEARSRRAGTALAVAHIDLDGFGRVNEVYSRTDGDQLLRAVAASLALTTRMGDVAARLGSDEFAVLFYGCAADDAHRVGQRLVDEVAELGRAYPEARVTASIGMAVSGSPGPEPDEMMRLADAALRRARQSGGNAVVVETRLAHELTAGNPAPGSAPPAPGV